MLEPELDKAKEATKEIARDIGDVLIYALYPTTGMRFLRWKYGLETPPPEVMPKTLEDVRREDELIAKLKAGKLAEKDPPATGGIRKFKVYIDDQVHTVGVEAVDRSLPDVPAVVADDPPPVESSVKDEPAVTVAAAEETAILAPLPGVILSYNVAVGTEVQADDVIVVLEAMKMANAITAPVSGRVKAINFKAGDSVERDAVLAIIA
jgi:pyruvate carboxylase subunit B